MNLAGNVARILIMMIVFGKKDLAWIADETGWDTAHQEMLVWGVKLDLLPGVWHLNARGQSV